MHIKLSPHAILTMTYENNSLYMIIYIVPIAKCLAFTVMKSRKCQAYNSYHIYAQILFDHRIPNT